MSIAELLLIAGNITLVSGELAANASCFQTTRTHTRMHTFTRTRILTFSYALHRRQVVGEFLEPKERFVALQAGLYVAVMLWWVHAYAQTT